MISPILGIRVRGMLSDLASAGCFLLARERGLLLARSLASRAYVAPAASSPAICVSLKRGQFMLFPSPVPAYIRRWHDDTPNDMCGWMTTSENDVICPSRYGRDGSDLIRPDTVPVPDPPDYSLSHLLQILLVQLTRVLPHLLKLDVQRGHPQFHSPAPASGRDGQLIRGRWRGHEFAELGTAGSGGYGFSGGGRGRGEW